MNINFQHSFLKKMTKIFQTEEKIVSKKRKNDMQKN